MSLLIKALNKAQDKAQEQVQIAKLKQAQTVPNNSGAQKKSKANSFYAKPLFAHESTSIHVGKSETLSLEQSASPSVDDQINGIDRPHQQANLSLEQNKTSSQKPAAPKIFSAIQNTSAQSAANVFTAKQLKPTRKFKTIFTIAMAGLLTLLAIGVYFYQFKNNKFDTTPNKPLPLLTNLQIDAFKKPPNENVVINQLPALDVQSTFGEAALSFNVEPKAEFRAVQNVTKPLKMAQKKEKSPEKSTNTNGVVNNINAVVFKDSNLENTNIEYLSANRDVTENSLKSDEILVEAKSIKNNTDKLNKQKINNNNAENVPSIASTSASMRISKSQSQNSINPILMNAYDAYNAGNDILALKLYKQVLQRDVSNSDALLGLGAIAGRQGRLADAMSWYAKVLEVDPKNSIAMTYLFENQPQNNEYNSETQLKNLLAKQPNDANLHALLGNFHAQKNQWPAAQQAYFDAFRLNASAESALNLAVSLDQMGKPALALPYYLQALILSKDVAKNSGSQIDKASIEARIKAIN